MKIQISKILLCLFIIFSCFVIKAQEKTDLPIPPLVDDEWECGLTATPLVEIYVSVLSSKKGNLKNLTYKDFEVYDEKEIREIEFFKYDELKNQYKIGFFQDENISENSWRNVKIKLKLSKEKTKDFGKISIKAQKGYFQKSKI